MKKESKYYIYFHINPLKNEIFYVGKGKGRRYYSTKKRNKFWHNIVNKYKFDSIIIHNYLTESEAFNLEIKYIAQIGRRDLNKGTLVNLTNGGKGSKNSRHSKKSISKMQTTNNNSIEVVQYDLSGKIIGTFISMADASRQNKCNRSHISSCCKKRKHYNTIKNTVFRFKGDAFDYVPDNNYSTTSKKTCQYNIDGILLKIFNSLNQAEKFTNVHSNSISQCMNGKLHSAGGFIWKRVGEPFSIQPRKKRKKNINNINCIKVIQKDKENNIIKIHNSIIEASKYVNIHPSTISKCCRKLPKCKTAGGFIWEYA